LQKTHGKDPSQGNVESKKMGGGGASNHLRKFPRRQTDSRAGAVTKSHQLVSRRGSKAGKPKTQKKKKKKKNPKIAAMPKQKKTYSVPQSAEEREVFIFHQQRRSRSRR